MTRVRWYASTLASIGIGSIIGFFFYFGYIMITQDVGPIVFGYLLAWLTLQILTFSVCLLTILLAGLWWHS